MATVFRTHRTRKDKTTGKSLVVCDDKGQPVMSPRWRAVILDHTGKRKTYTLTANKRESQVQADMIQAREREIVNGLRPKPDTGSRPFMDVLSEYFAWGQTQGGRRGLPWDDEYAHKKQRDLLFWRDALALKSLSDTIGSLPKVESECRKLLTVGNSGKTVWNKVQNLRGMLVWCKKRCYLKENPLAALRKFNTEPSFCRRAMTLDEYRKLLSACAPHRRLLYEMAACSGLRENELRMLEPRHLDVVHNAVHVERKMDKARRERHHPIPVPLVRKLVTFIATGAAKTHYSRAYKNQGKRPGSKRPPKDPLLYVPSNSASMLKRDHEAACISYETEDGRLDFHVLRTAYINFLIDLGATLKTIQELARHATVATTLDFYARARKDTKREVVEALGEILLAKPA